jgi:hypothetical protein
MTTLHHLTIDVLENQRRAAKTVLAAVRQGAMRTYGRIDSAWERGLELGLAAKISEELKSTLLDAEKKVSGAAVGGVEQVTSYIDARVDQAYDLATDGLRSERAQKLYDTRMYGFVSQASLPLAKLSVKVSAGMAEGVEKLAERVAPAEAVAEQAAKVVKTVKTRARKATAAPRRAVKQAAEKVVAKTRRRRAAA